MANVKENDDFKHNLMMKFTLNYFRYHNEKQVGAISPSVISYYDLTLVLEGCLEYKINNKRVTVKENSALLLPPGTKREREHTEGATTYVSFNFTLEEGLDLPILMEGAVGKDVRMMIYACNEINRDHGEYSKNSFLDLTSAIVNSLLALANKNKNSALTENILAYIRENYRHPLTLGNVAKEMNYSATYCDQVFKKDVGLSIVQYLIDYRIAKAKEFLIENIISLKEIAERTGFGECNYLSRQFRRREGISPLRFRKQFNP